MERGCHVAVARGGLCMVSLLPALKGSVTTLGERARYGFLLLLISSSSLYFFSIYAIA